MRRDEENTLECKFEDCEKICKSRAELAKHQRGIHGDEFDTEATMKNHRNRCTGVCEEEVTRSKIARPRRKCAERRVAEAERHHDEGGDDQVARVYVARTKE